jgi:hypothetical protein
MRARTTVSMIMAAMVICLIGAYAADSPTAKKGEEVTMQGTLTCAFCTLVDPQHAMNKACCQGCLKSGDSTILSDGKGGLFLLITGEHEKPLKTPEVVAMAGDQVTVKGRLVKGSGLQGIYVEKIEKAADSKDAAQSEKKEDKPAPDATKPAPAEPK